MKQNAIIFLTSIVVLFLGCDHKGSQKSSGCSVSSKIEKKFNVQQVKAELQELKRVIKETGSSQCCQRYIEQVIEHGSSVLNLPAGVMDAGYAEGDDIKKIASYVLTLSGREAIYPEFLQEGNMLFSGNCAGCHGDDGKGMNGSYPDLTRSLFKGAQLRKENYIEKIYQLEKELKVSQHVK
jgi:hypothetical protein